MSTDQTGLLYKSKYKFIEFQKKGSYNTQAKASNESVEQPPDIKEFYSDLISSESVPREPETERISRTAKQRKISEVTMTSFLRACQNDEVSTVKDFLTSRPSSLNATDQFGWNGLMIAIAGNSRHVLKYLFTHQRHNRLFKDLLETKDSTGTETAHSIALKSKNTHAIQLIDSWYTEVAKKEPELILLDDDEDEDNETPVCSKDSQILCSICQTLYAPVDETTHLTSIVHQLALCQQEEQPTTDKIKYNFHLGASNKGYQLLCKSGWEHRRGLGKQEQGLVFPIKAVPKANRSGIGAESNKVETKRSKYVFDAKRLNLEKAKSTAETSTSLESQLKHYKYAQKKRNKEKRLEKDFRSYYNSS